MRKRLTSITLVTLLILSIILPRYAQATVSAAPQSQPGLQGEIAYVLDGDIWLVDLFTSKSQQLTKDGNNRWPAWSPDGRYLLYTHDTGEEEYELYILEVGRSTPKLLSKAACCAAWRGNSEEIVFLSLLDEQLAIETINRDGSTRKQIFSSLSVGRSDWPAGNMAWVKNTDGEGLIIPLEGIIRTPDALLVEYKSVAFFDLDRNSSDDSVTPDPLCFTLNAAFPPDQSLRFAASYIVNGPGCSQLQFPRGILYVEEKPNSENLSTDLPWLSYPSFSPNSNFLAAERYEESDEPLNAPLWGLIIHNLSDSSQQELVEGGSQPAWRPAVPVDPVAARYAQPGERVVTVEPALSYQGSTYQVSFLTTGDYQSKLFHITTPRFFSDQQITALVVTKDGKVVTDVETLRQIFLLYTAAYYIYEYPPTEAVPEFREELNQVINNPIFMALEVEQLLRSRRDQSAEALRAILTDQQRAKVRLNALYGQAFQKTPANIEEALTALNATIKNQATHDTLLRLVNEDLNATYANVDQTVQGNKQRLKLMRLVHLGGNNHTILR